MLEMDCRSADAAKYRRAGRTSIAAELPVMAKMTKTIILSCLLRSFIFRGMAGFPFAPVAVLVASKEAFDVPRRAKVPVGEVLEVAMEFSDRNLLIPV